MMGDCDGNDDARPSQQTTQLNILRRIVERCVSRCVAEIGEPPIGKNPFVVLWASRRHDGGL